MGRLYQSGADESGDSGGDRGAGSDYHPEISEALGGVEISDQSNVSKVLLAVAEGSCQVGTTYYSDTCGYEEELEILETVDYDLTGDVIYPVCRVENRWADERAEPGGG